jgi:hypothetical protein
MDPTLNTLVTDGQGYIYALSDPSFTSPLVTKDRFGTEMNGVRTTYNGVTEEFFVEDQPVVWWSSGPYSFMVVSFTSLVEAANQAAASASAAAAAAEAAATAAQNASGGGEPVDLAALDLRYAQLNTTYSSTGSGYAYRSITFQQRPTTNAPDIERIIIDGVEARWFNEWGALRGTPTLNLKDDALVRGVRRSDLGPTSIGGFIELEDRSYPDTDGRRKSYGVRWRDGATFRNNIEMSFAYVRYGAAAIPPNLPAGTVVVTVND